MDESTGSPDPVSTIFAPATAPGRAGVAIVRVSGPAAGRTIQALSGKPVPAPRVAAFRRLKDPRDGHPLDEGLVLWFPGPASFTGEDMAEFQIHGGRAVMEAMLGALGAIDGLVPAGPGDFTRRAVAHGKLDLTQAEGLIDLIDAETEGQRRQAARQMDGALGRLYEGWRDEIHRALAYAEAEIDFPDEGDVPEGLIARVRPWIEAVMAQMAAHLKDGRRGERLRDGVSVVLLGAPNAGKSTLLNALARRDVAIVSDIAGTTRDTLDVALDLGGIPVVLTDTAGLRDGGDAIEAEGIRRAKRRAIEADIRVHVVDGSAGERSDWTVTDTATPDLKVVTKLDVTTADTPQGSRIYGLSAVTGEGLDRFVEGLTNLVKVRYDPGEAPALTRHRHRAALEASHDALHRALSGADGMPELVAEDLRAAAHALGRITGRVDVEDLLDIVFRDFCVGK